MATTSIPRILLVIPLLLIGVSSSSAQMTLEQQSYINQRFGMFIHFGINTFYDQEWGDGTEDPALFNPTTLDADQWAETGVNAKMKYMIMTTKHHEGFCLWDSAHTDFDVASSPWKSGQGDVVQEFVDAARKRGMNVGLYYSVWDRHQPSYENDWGTYTRYVKNQLTELLSNYGEIKVIWFDVWDLQRVPYAEIYNHVKSLQPQCVVVNQGKPDHTDIITYFLILPSSRDSRPKESHFTIRSDNKWFYHEVGNNQLLSTDEILHGITTLNNNFGTYLLNVTPDTTGLIPAKQVERLVEVGRSLEYSGRIVYVNADAAGANDGSSWANAFWCLQDALAVAQSGDEIRVAQGTYKPDQQVVVSPRSGPQVVSSGDRTVSFSLKNGVAVRGGHAGVGAADANVKNRILYETILSGDLAGDDVPVSNPTDMANEPTRSENSYHVVWGGNTDNTAVMEGFTITAGNADGDWREGYFGGGGFCNWYGSPVVMDCLFTGNSGGNGGGMRNAYAGTTILNCTYMGNATIKEWGGGIVNIGCDDITIAGCLFVGNVSDTEGGGIYSRNSTVTISNSTLYGNSARNAGGGVFNDSVNNFAMMNSILWANVDASGSAQTSQVNSGVVNHTCVQGWTGTYGGVGNINADPCFADANKGDYHLKSQAGRWDSTSQSWVKDDVTSPCIDAGDPNNCLGVHEPYPNGFVINMGAYGGTAEASMSLSLDKCDPGWGPYNDWVKVGEPVCWRYRRQCHGDADCKPQGKQKYWVSTNDLDVLIAAWNKTFAEIEGETVNGVPLICADFDHMPQGKQKFRVSTNDLDILIANWNKANAPPADCP
jgi:alpha-L-fucosidase